MLQRRWRCVCGKEALVPVQALGESISCPACRKPAQITLKNSHPVAPSPEVLHVHTEAAQAEACGRCGRKFRGAWDQNPCGDEVLCDICVRKVGQAMYTPPNESRRRENVLPLAPGEAVSTAELQDTFDAVIPDLQVRLPDAKNRYYERLACMILAVTIVLVAIAVYVMQFLVPHDEFMHSVNPLGVAGELANFFLALLIVHFVSFYTTLWLFDRLPNDTHLANMLSVATMCTFFAALCVIGELGGVSFVVFLVYFIVAKYIYNFGWFELMIAFVVARVLLYCTSAMF